MHVIDRRNGVLILHLQNESAVFCTPAGEKRVLTADDRDVLCTARIGRYGEKWLGSWRQINGDLNGRRVTLKGKVIFSDRQCRRAETDGGPDVCKGECLMQRLPLLDGECVLRNRKKLYVVKKTWLGKIRQSRGNVQRQKKGKNKNHGQSDR